VIPRRIVVTGASRGLGLGMTRRWLADGREVLALARDPEHAPALAELAAAHSGRLLIARCDVTSETELMAAVDRAASAWGVVDLLVNNAAVMGQQGAGLATLDLTDLAHTLEVDAIAPLRVTRAFMPLLLRSPLPRVAHISSAMGSIEGNSEGGYWAYRMSKAALNMASRNLALEFRDRGLRAVSVVLHPGWVRTDMGGPEATLSIEESVAALVPAIDQLGAAHSGGFFDRKLRVVPY